MSCRCSRAAANTLRCEPTARLEPVYGSLCAIEPGRRLPPHDRDAKPGATRVPPGWAAEPRDHWLEVRSRRDVWRESGSPIPLVLARSGRGTYGAQSGSVVPIQGPTGDAGPGSQDGKWNGANPLSRLEFLPAKDWPGAPTQHRSGQHHPEWYPSLPNFPSRCPPTGLHLGRRSSFSTYLAARPVWGTCHSRSGQEPAGIRPCSARHNWWCRMSRNRRLPHRNWSNPHPTSWATRTPREAQTRPAWESSSDPRRSTPRRSRHSIQTSTPTPDPGAGSRAVPGSTPTLTTTRVCDSNSWEAILKREGPLVQQLIRCKIAIRRLSTGSPFVTLGNRLSMTAMTVVSVRWTRQFLRLIPRPIPQSGRLP